nr:MAG TPA: hypothetical protein [Caudoviricetes sp.]
MTITDISDNLYLWLINNPNTIRQKYHKSHEITMVNRIT